MGALLLLPGCALADLHRPAAPSSSTSHVTRTPDASPSATGSPLADAAPASAPSSTPVPTGAQATASATTRHGVLEDTIVPADMPPVPAAARAHTDAGARAFTIYYMDVERAAFLHRRPEWFPPVSSGECSACVRTAYEVQDNLIAPNAHVESYSTRFTPSESRALPEERHLVTGRLWRAATRRLSSSGAVLNEVPGYDRDVAFALVWTADGWLVATLTSV